MSHKEQWDAGELLREPLGEELDVLQLPIPVRLPVRGVLALVRTVEGRAAVAPQVEREHGDAARGVLHMRQLVPADVLCEAVDEQHDRLRERRGVRPGVELVAVKARQPRFDERRGHAGLGRGQEWARPPSCAYVCVVQDEPPADLASGGELGI